MLLFISDYKYIWLYGFYINCLIRFFFNCSSYSGLKYLLRKQFANNFVSLMELVTQCSVIISSLSRGMFHFLGVLSLEWYALCARVVPAYVVYTLLLSWWLFCIGKVTLTMIIVLGILSFSGVGTCSLDIKSMSFVLPQPVSPMIITGIFTL